MIIERDPRLPAIRHILPRRLGDARGWFAEVWRADTFLAAGLDVVFVQENQSFSKPVGTLRGLHFQSGRNAQAKLVRCLRGRILDVAVDIRIDSPTFGMSLACELSAERGEQLLIPIGFAHGFCTLEPDCEVAYKVSAPYDAAEDRGLRYDDPALGIAWPTPASGLVLSPKDRTHPALADLPLYFRFSDLPD